MELPEQKIVLLGNTGYGKSTTGNTILGGNVFITDASPNSVTDKPIKRDAIVNGRKMTVIDTPGFDTDCDETTKSEILKALIECAPGVDAFIIFLRVGRYSKHEKKIVENFLNTFKKEEVLKHTVILFTFGEQLEGQSIEEFVKKSSELQDLVDQCGGRCHVIDNKHWNNNESGDKSNRVHVKNLLDTIDEMVKVNGRYTNDLLKMVEEEIQEEMKKMKDSNLTSDEKRDKAKEIVHKRWRQVVGGLTGFVFGALVGAGSAVALILVILKYFKNCLPLLGFAAGAAAAAAVRATEKKGATEEATVRAAAGAMAIAAVEAAEAQGTAVGILLGAAVVGALGGTVTGWKAAEEADSMYDAMIMATKLNYENAKCVVEKATEIVLSLINDK